jgi:hypothetical protein
MRLGLGFPRVGRVASSGAAALVLLLGPTTAAVEVSETQAMQELTTTHPRLWLRSSDLSELRSRATASNPIWSRGLLVLAESARRDMQRGRVPAEDSGGIAWEQYPAEAYAELLAFVSLVHPSTAERADYARRARTLLMHVIRRAAPGPADGEPFRDPAFATDDRSRWWGESFALSVDWIYPHLSLSDRRLLRKVFLRWAGENDRAETTSHNHPEPIGVVNDPRLVRDKLLVRWAANNYFTAHARNLGLTALALDAGDDPGARLRGYLRPATGAWLYMIDHLLRTEARGGLSPEGFEYGPQSLGYVAQLLLALSTAGADDVPRFGRQATFRGNPFWDDLLRAWAHSLSPAPTRDRDLGVVRLPAWYGDGQRYAMPDPIAVVAPLGIWARSTGEAGHFQAACWIARELAPGGGRRATVRAAEAERFSAAILAFLLYDPEAPCSFDPRRKFPLRHFAAGTGRVLARTGWGPEAAWFTYGLGYTGLDHQHGDGNAFELYRGGEWLTKEQTGYGDDLASSDFHNTVTIQNARPEHDDASDPRGVAWRRGSQWPYVASGDGRIVARTFGRGFVYVLGDATRLYNSAYEGSTDVRHVSRSIVWLQPDHVILYDRIETRTAGRFKRFWLQLPSRPVISGLTATAATPRGQRVVVTTLLPTDARLSGDPPEPAEVDEQRAEGEPMRHRIRVEVPGAPASVRLLHVIQGVDRHGHADRARLVTSETGGRLAGAQVAGVLVLSPVSLRPAVRAIVVPLPPSTRRVLVTGLVPGSGWSVRRQGDRLVVRDGHGWRADSGGVLDLRLP